MKHELPPPSPALSLQNKLDQIAHDRDVLALLRELARQGLREGDEVRSVAGDRQGRVQVLRHDQPPRAVVQLDGGAYEDYSAERWRRRG